MMSTIGLMPVIAAPTPRPVNPASEIGVSMTRPGPNSWTRPVSTLNAVPASATSSPSSTTRGSRRISSAIASFTASPKVSSRGEATAETAEFAEEPFFSACAARSAVAFLSALSAISARSALCIHVLDHFFDARIRRVERPAHRLVHLARHLRVDAIQGRAVGGSGCDEVPGENCDRISIVHPALLFLLRPVVIAADVANVVTAKSIGVGNDERRAVAAPRARDQRRDGVADRADILTVHACRLEAERRRPRRDLPRRGLGEVRVFVVEIVLAEINHRQLPQLRQVHRLVENALAERAFAEEADDDAVLLEIPR